MTIKTRLSLIFFAVIVLCAGTVAGSFLVIESRRLNAEVSRRTQLIADTAAKAAQESLIDEDDLLAIRQMKLLMSEHPELLAMTVELRSGAIRLGPPVVEAAQKPLAVSRTVAIRAGARSAAGRPAGPAVLSFRLEFSGRMLEDEVRAEMSRSARRTLGVTALLAALGLAVSALLGGSLTRRLRLLTEAISELGEGRLGTQIAGGGSDEIGRLAGKFNEMSVKLLEVDRMKKDLVASVTHDLKNPLAAMESYLRMLIENNGMSAQQVQHLRRIEDNAVRLGQTIANLLEKAKIERGALDFQPGPADFAALLEDMTLFYQPRLREAGLKLVRWTQPGPLEAWLDRDGVQRVLLNLIGNAVAYTPRGGTVTVTGFRLPDGGILCQVEDTGVGIRREDQKRLFKAFERVRSGIKAPGVGLGLSICKAIVERHGGRIGVDSSPGRGSRFWFTLPARPAGVVSA